MGNLRGGGKRGRLGGEGKGEGGRGDGLGGSGLAVHMVGCSRAYKICHILCLTTVLLYSGEHSHLLFSVPFTGLDASVTRASRGLLPRPCSWSACVAVLTITKQAKQRAA
eukprot:1077354-Pelagomonas_calceolata.AAC.3